MTEWKNPHEPLPKEAKKPTPSIIERATAVVKSDVAEHPPEILAAVIIAQALDRLGEKLIEAASISKPASK